MKTAAKQPFADVPQNRCSEKFRNSLRETPVLDFLGYLGTATLLKRDSNTGAFQ